MSDGLNRNDTLSDADRDWQRGYESGASGHDRPDLETLDFICGWAKGAFDAGMLAAGEVEQAVIGAAIYAESEH